jgi:DNA-binding NarL/FixJ family response regulator
VSRILLVEDHEIMRRGVRDLLADALADATFGEAGDVAEAEAQLARQRWDLVVLDINLPGRSGLELLQSVRGEHPTVAFLVLTAYPEEELAVRCLRLGAAGYVTKSSAAAELVSAARKVLEGGRYVTASLAEQLASYVGGESAGAPHDQLSPRELQVLKLLATGKTFREIGAELHLSEKTVATYRARLGEKLGISRAAELVRYALRHGLVE